MDSFFERLHTIPDKITYHSNHTYAPRRQEWAEMPTEPMNDIRVVGAGMQGRKRTRKSRFGGIPNGAVVAYKQNNNSAPVLVNTATAKRLMVNKADPMHHGGRKRRSTRKN
jgi:hypothetical protein